MHTSTTLSASPWERVTETPCARGEAPFWHAREQRLYWMDRGNQRLWRLHPPSQRLEHWDVGHGLASVAPCRSGSLLLGLADGLYRAQSWGDVPQRLAVLPHDPTRLQLSDGKCDPWGRFWTGCLGQPRTGADASVYALHPLQAGTPLLHTAYSGLSATQGLAWSADGRNLYRTDPSKWQISRHRLDNPGLWPPALGVAELWARFPDASQGQPGGLAIDRLGRVWVAMVNGGRVLCLSAEGQVLGDFPTPLQCPVMLCFGDPDLQTLYLTSARAGRSDDELARYPGSGCIYRMRTDSPGLATGFYWD